MTEANPRSAKPAWLKTPLPSGSTFFRIRRDLRERKLFTVCEEAKCPNIGQCWSTNTATFMVLGGVCTRACRFCHVATGNPGGWLDSNEPSQVAESAKSMNLSYVVITMVDRDDLPDGGAAHVARVVREVRALNPGIVIELLAGDFRNRRDSLDILLSECPEVFAHNLETVQRLTPRVRDARASYHQSLAVLQAMKDRGPPQLLTKSSLMLGLGEARDEVIDTMKDLRARSVDILTLGQYMRPTPKHLSVKAWIEPQIFDELRLVGEDLGFRQVLSGPLVRSSFRAHEVYAAARSSAPGP